MFVITMYFGRLVLPMGSPLKNKEFTYIHTSLCLLVLVSVSVLFSPSVGCIDDI